jgi:hypothetical protein
LNFKFIHIYIDDLQLDAKAIAEEIVKIFPKCAVDICLPFPINEIELARIADIKQPFEKQPAHIDDRFPLYDGFMLQRLVTELIPDAKRDQLHMIFTSLLTCTFSEDDWRYHGRTVICGTPSIISTTGIVEAPAKPSEFYWAQYRLADVDSIKKKFVGKFIDYGDSRMTAAAAIYTLQAIFFFVNDGEPFCENRDCLLFNAHWQEDLIHILEKPSLCSKHQKVANKFNKRFREL